MEYTCTFSGGVGDTAETTRVSDIMTEDVRVISTTESLLHCADILLIQRVRRLPVTRTDGQVVGTVYLRDTYRCSVGFCHVESVNRHLKNILMVGSSKSND